MVALRQCSVWNHGCALVVVDTLWGVAMVAGIGSAKSVGIQGDTAISAEGLHKAFGKVKALAGIDLTVPSGTVMAILGAKGSGKTTFIRILTTLLLPDAGSATVAGYDVVRNAAEVRSLIGLAGQYAAVGDKLTGRENLGRGTRVYHF